jgi:transcriptional regulator with XRE-family HTH domain
MAHQVSAGSGAEPGDVQGGGQRSGHDREWAVGEVIREIRCALGWSQGRLAAEVGRVSARPTVTREMVSRWEHGKRKPGPFWLRHIAAALQVPEWELEGRVRRREMLALAAAGEDIRWLPRRRASGLALPGNDCWIFDGRLVLWNHFTGEGDVSPDGRELTDDPEIIKLCSSAFESAWERGIPHQEYRPI